MLGAMQADTPWPGLMSALDEIASNKRVADELSKEERARADELCDQIKAMLTPSHVLSRNLRAAASSARTPVDRGAVTLPAELFLADFRDSIFMHLRVGDLGSATAVCKAWSTDDAWRAAYARRWLYIGGDDDGDGIGFFKLSYALRDACESRDFDEAELIADAENKRLAEDGWVYRYAMVHPDADLVRSNSNKEANVTNTCQFRSLAIDWVRKGLLSEGSGVSLESAKAILDLFEQGLDVQHHFRMSASIPEMANEEGAVERESETCIRLTITSPENRATYFTYSRLDNPGLHWGEDCPETAVTQLMAYELGKFDLQPPDGAWTLKALRAKVHGEAVSEQGAPLWSTHQIRQLGHVRSAEPDYVSTTGIWPVKLLRSEAEGYSRLSSNATNFECDEVHRIEHLLESSLGLEPDVVGLDNLLLAFTLLFDMTTVKRWNGIQKKYGDASVLWTGVPAGRWNYDDDPLRRFCWCPQNAKEMILKRIGGTDAFSIFCCPCCSSCGSRVHSER